MVREALFFALALTVLPAAAPRAAEIHTVAQEGDLTRLRELVAADPELANARDERGCSPLHLAAGEGHRAAVDWLLDHGAAINAIDHKGEAPLLYAVKRLRYDTVERLIRRGAEIETRNEYGRTPLLQCVREGGDLRMARLLLALGADVNAQDTNGSTPLALAAWRGFGSVINVLLDHGAEVEVEGHKGQMLLSEAIGRGLPRLYQRLVAGGMEIPINRDDGRSLMRRAAVGGSAEIAVDLIGRGANVEAADYFGWTPLHYAAAHRRPEVTAALLKHVENPNHRTLSGYSALNLAREKGGEEAARILLAHGVDPAPRAFPTLTGPYLGQASPEGRPAPFAPDIVATPYDQHGNITFSPDGREAFWAGSVDVADSGFVYGTILCSREIGGRWLPPRLASFATPQHGDDVPIFSPDGQKLYFMTRRPLTPGGEVGKENIWVVARQGDGWGDPEPLPPLINCFDHHWQVCVAGNGNLYFNSRTTTSETEGIYRSRYVNGQYLEPEFLGIPGEMPYVPADESYLITFQFGGEWGRNYIRFRQRDGSWGDPIDLNAAAGRGVIGTCPSVSLDGRYFFFVRSVYESDATWWVEADFIEELRQQQSG